MTSTRMRSLSTTIATACAAVAALVLSGCGGGGAADGTISSTSVKGPVSAGTLAAYRVNNGQRGDEIGRCTTDEQGNCTLSVGNHSGPVMLRMSGGTYTDEATGQRMNMGAADAMSALIDQMCEGCAITGVQVTPLTSMAQSMAACMAGGMTSGNIVTANREVGAYFRINDILRTRPMNPLDNGSGTAATDDSRHYGIALGAMSRYAVNMGMSASSPVVSAMTADACDGVLDGQDRGQPISMERGPMYRDAGTIGLATAMRDFVGSIRNTSGVTLEQMATLLQSLESSNGRIH